MYALKLNVVVFAVSYPLAGSTYGDAPESSVKYPDGQGGEVEMTIPATEGKWCSADECANSVLAGIRWIHENADKYCVDKSKLILDGTSGGGYIMGMACARSAVLGESHLIKVAIMSQGTNPGYYILKKKEEMTDIGKTGLMDAPFAAQAFAIDHDNQWKNKDPVLFPQHAPDSNLKCWPPTIMNSAEFDTFEEAVKEFIPRLKKVGRYLDNVCFPGATHGFHYNPLLKRSEDFYKDMNDLVQTYANK